MKKALQQRPKGWKFEGSPDWNIDRTFIYQFFFQVTVKKSSTNKKKYRNPIYLAREYNKMIDSGEVKSQSELARKLGISRARVIQILNLLKLDKIKQIEDPMDKKIISERAFRKIINQS